MLIITILFQKQCLKDQQPMIVLRRGSDRFPNPLWGNIPAEAAAAALEAEANLAARPATKPFMGEVDGLALKAGKSAKFKIPSKVGSTKSLKSEEVIVYNGSSGFKSDHKGPKSECETKSSWNAKKK